MAEILTIEELAAINKKAEALVESMRANNRDANYVLLDGNIYQLSAYITQAESSALVALQKEAELNRLSRELQRQDILIKREIAKYSQIVPSPVITIAECKAGVEFYNDPRESVEQRGRYGFIVPCSYAPKRIAYHKENTSRFKTISAAHQKTLEHNDLLLMIFCWPGSSGVAVMLLHKESRARFYHYHSMGDKDCMGTYHPNTPASGKEALAIRDAYAKMLEDLNGYDIPSHHPARLPTFENVQDASKAEEAKEEKLPETEIKISPSTGMWRIQEG